MVFWDRATLKIRAKQVLTKSYWMSFAVMIVYGIVSGVSASGSTSFNANMGATYNMSGNYGFAHAAFNMLPIIATVISIVSVVGMVYYVFLGNLLEIGKNRFFTLCRYNTISFDEMLFGFKNGMYMSNVKTMFMRGLYTFLWSLLLFVPGIIKAYSYWMIPYILAENPTLSTQRAFEISMKATEGEKWNIFVLELSFIGWYLLGALACGVGIIFVNPYSEATKAELYGALRFKAVTNGICDKSEIGAEL